MAELTRELEVARRLALEAGRLVMDLYGRVDREAKPGDEPVTEADRAANAILVDGLTAAFPGDGILAEESAPHPEWWKKRRVWCVDPIDGTKEYLAQNGEFAVMLGLADGSRAVLGVVLLPARGVLYVGGPALGTVALSVEDGTETALHVSDHRDLSQMTMAISRSHRSRRVGAMARRLGITKEVRSGSVGVKLGLVATAACDVYLHPAGGTKLWDACGPDAVLAGAGGVLTDCHGRPIDYDTDVVENRAGLVASNGPCHDEIIARIRPVVEDAGL